ncbi:hypothetical protein MKX75_07400 [Paenibacillus sp. FSL R5-0341]|uniref:hypothetical protein n=1 Tax=Paenibacillus sp. FSL R5-0341 TaxID=2921636 RepID=UPI0030D2020C
MPVKRGKNFRSGDLAEQLGIYMIQSLALVAPIPRTEDVGIDVVATLLRDDNKYSYVAEDSFYIQIKSSTVNKVEYEEEGVKWLYDLKLPFFIATVDREISMIKLYSTKRIFDAFAINKDRRKINIILEEEEKVKIYDFVDSNIEDIYTGAPIIEWSVNELMTDEKEVRERFYIILKEHIRIIQESMELHEIGLGSTYLWETNKLPSFFSWKGSTNANIDFEVIADRMMNYLNKVLDISTVVGTRIVFDEVKSTLEFYESIYENYESVRQQSDKLNRD